MSFILHPDGRGANFFTTSTTEKKSLRENEPLIELFRYAAPNLPDFHISLGRAAARPGIRTTAVVVLGSVNSSTYSAGKS